MKLLNKKVEQMGKVASIRKERIERQVKALAEVKNVYGLSSQDLSEVLSVTSERVRNWEEGKRVMATHEAYQLHYWERSKAGIEKKLAQREKLAKEANCEQKETAL